MTALSAADLTAIRNAIAELLPDTCNLLTFTRTSDGAGGYTESWGTATADVACRLDQKNGYEQLAGGALQPYTFWMLTLPHNTTITTAYRVQHGGNEYAVSNVDTDKSWKASMRVKLEAV